MIHDLSKTLYEILSDPTEEAVKSRGRLPVELAAAKIAFDHPSENFSQQHPQTTVDLFLYDIREDLELRSNESVIERRNGKVITHRPPLRVACSYLVTAWPVGASDPDLLEAPLQEQRLLSQVLQVLARLPTIPEHFLQGSLRDQSPPLPMITAVVDPQKNLSEFWTALGSQMRPTLTVSATFAMEVLKPETAAEVVKEELQLGRLSAWGEEDLIPDRVETVEYIGITGRISDFKGRAVTGAHVSLAELGVGTSTDAEGRYRLLVKQPRDYILQVQVGRTVKSKPITAKAGAENDVQLDPPKSVN